MSYFQQMQSYTRTLVLIQTAIYKYASFVGCAIMQLPDLVASMLVYLKRKMSGHPENDITTNRELHDQMIRKNNDSNSKGVTKHPGNKTIP